MKEDFIKQAEDLVNELKNIDNPVAKDLATRIENGIKEYLAMQIEQRKITRDAIEKWLKDACKKAETFLNKEKIKTQK